MGRGCCSEASTFPSTAGRTKIVTFDVTTRQLPSDLRVAIAPHTTYQQLQRAHVTTTWPGALRRPALWALLVGTSVAAAATGGVSPVLVLSTTLSWCWVVVLQLAIAMAMVQPLPRDVDRAFPRALELWFAGHAPWTIWLLVLVPVVRLRPDLSVEALVLSMLVPMAWTARIAAAFSQVVLGRTAAESWIRAVAHLAAVVALILSFVAWSAGGWFRLLG